MTGAPAAARKQARSSSRPSHASASGRTAAVLAATFATNGDGVRWTITFAPSARMAGSTPVTPSAAAAETAARAASPAPLVAGTEAADDQGEGERESIKGGAGRQLGRVALGLREGVGQGREPAKQLVASRSPPFPACLPVLQGGLQAEGADVEGQRVDRPRRRPRVDAAGQH